MIALNPARAECTNVIFAKRLNFKIWWKLKLLCIILAELKNSLLQMKLQNSVSSEVVGFYRNATTLEQWPSPDLKFQL